MLTADRFTFPSRIAEWFERNGLPRSQWRDRAGVAPDFPIKPLGRLKDTVKVAWTQGGVKALASITLVILKL